MKRQERKVREDFQKFLQELHKKGEQDFPICWCFINDHRDYLQGS